MWYWWVGDIRYTSNLMFRSSISEKLDKTPNKHWYDALVPKYDPEAKTLRKFLDGYEKEGVDLRDGT